MAATLRGRRVLITGATRGIGRETARQLAPLGPDLVLVARDRGRGEALAEELRALGAGSADFLQADLSVQDGVRRAAAHVRDRYDALHVLLNNAGGVNARRELTADGHELTFALNHVAPFLLTQELLPLLRRSAPSRIVTVSSDAHRGGRIDFDDLEGERRYRGWRLYSQSKLANILFTHELARRLEGTGVTAITLHPGFVASDFGRNQEGWMKRLMPLAHRFAISVEEGARTSVYAASSPDAEGMNGAYLVKCRQARPTSRANDSAVALRLWEVSERMTAPAPAGAGVSVSPGQAAVARPH